MDLKRKSSHLDAVFKKAAVFPDLHPIVELCRWDPLTYFAVLPRDCLSHLSAFLPHRLGVVEDPAKLRLCVTVPFQFNACTRAMCFDLQHRLVVAGLLKVFVYDLCDAGKRVTRFGGGGECEVLTGCVVDFKGRIYVSQRWQERVSVFSDDYVLKEEIAVAAPRGLALSTFEYILYVCSEDSVKAFSTRSGKTLGEIGNGVLSRPDTVAVLSTKEIVVGTDTQIFVFNYDGSTVRSLGCDMMKHIDQLVVDANDHIYVVGPQNGTEVRVFSAYGELLHTLKGLGREEMKSSCAGVAIDQSGVVALAYMDGVDLYSCE
jgi:hypothetical protein